MTDTRARPLEARAPGFGYQQLLDLDRRHAIPEPLRFERPADLGTDPVSASRYTDRAFFQLEIDKVFLKSWQYACREEEIAEAGDSYVFDLVGRSLIVTRQADGSIRAMRNVCLHRGRKLMTEGGCKKHFRCPYHGLAWNIDGSFKENPFAWDFPQVDTDDFTLEQARVDSWAGFVFVNFDPNAEPLLKQLGEMPRHFEHWRINDCYKAAHVAKEVPANWKAVAEAFMESYHSFATHPQVGSYMGADLAPYDLISDHVTRFIVPIGVTSPAWHEDGLTEKLKIQAMMRVGSRAGKPGQSAPEISLQPGETARTYMAEVGRRALQAENGYDLSNACDADIIDGIAYSVFPNFHLWGGFGQKICYRFRPVGLNHERALMEVMLFKLAPKDQPRPAPAPLRTLAEDELWADAPELGYLSGIFDQDQSNLGPVQEGLRDLGADGVIHFSRYAEMPCRNLHRMIDTYIAR